MERIMMLKLFLCFFILLGNSCFSLNGQEEIYKKAIKYNPKDEIAWQELAEILREKGKNEEAEAAYRKVIELDPTNNWAKSKLADFLKKLGKYKEVEEIYKKALKNDIKNSWLWQELADFL
jgi:protein O-mannosyl-transferase